jgi:hypothetical protein
MDHLSYALQSGLFDRERKLIITSDFVEFENKDQIGNEFTRFLRTDVVDVKFGTDPIYWYKFNVGIKYSVAFRRKDDQILLITFRSYFNAKREYWDWYCEIVRKVQEVYLQQIVEGQLTHFKSHGQLTLGRIKLDKKRVSVNDTGLYFDWQDLDVKEYQRYFVISRRSAPEFHIWIDDNQWFTEQLYRLIHVLKTEAHD